MKKSFIPLAAFALLALVSCSNNTPSSNSGVTPSSSSISAEVVNSVTITNKSELTADWHLDQSDRTLSVTVDPSGNVKQLVADGKITVTSSNTAVIAISGITLQAKSVGSATITVTYGDKSDSVDLTILAERSAIELYGTVHAGTEDDPLDNADALKVATVTGTTATEKYFYVGGVVEAYKDAPSSYGNVSYYLKKGENDTASFMIYQAKLDDTKFTSATVTDDDIWVGAEVVAKVKIINFKGTVPETNSGGTIVSIKGTKPTRTITESNVADALSATKKLGVNRCSDYKYTVTGYITSTDSYGFYLSDTKGEVEASRENFFAATSAYKKVDDSASILEKCTVNAKVKLTGYLCYYVSTSNSETYNYELHPVSVIEIVEEGDAKKAAEEISVADALNKINALEDGEQTDVEYAVTGYVSSVKYTYKDSYKNMSFYLGADASASEKESIYVYNTGVAEGTDPSKIVKGAKVKVTAYLQKYAKTTDGTTTITPEALSGTTTLLEEAPTEEITVAKGIELANALGDNKTSDMQYAITGYVVEVTEAYNDTYKNMTFTIGDTATAADGATITVYRTKMAEGTDHSKIVKGVKVKVTANLNKNVYNGTTTLQAKSGTTAIVADAAA